MTSTQNFMHYFLEENLWKLSSKFDPWWVAFNRGNGNRPKDERKIWMFPKIVGFPPNHPMFNLGFHYFHHPFWVPLFLETPILEGYPLNHVYGRNGNDLWNPPTSTYNPPKQMPTESNWYERNTTIKYTPLKVNITPAKWWDWKTILSYWVPGTFQGRNAKLCFPLRGGAQGLKYHQLLLPPEI